MPLSTFEYSSSNIPAFLSKLWTLVEDKKYDELIAWDQSGYSFHVFDQTRFAREILPRFFKHNNMASFIRQLNMYGFRKVNSIEHGSLKNEKDDMEFHHPYFIRNKEHFLEYIKRKVSSGSSQPIKKEELINGNLLDSSATTTTTNNGTTTNQRLNSRQQYGASVTDTQPPTSDTLVTILEGVKTMQDKQTDVVSRLEYLKRENEALWKEVANLRQKHHHQQQIVNRLIQFLVHLVNPSSMGIKRSRPLMIDSHATLTNINDNSNDALLFDHDQAQNIVKLSRENMDDEPRAKHMRYDSATSDQPNGSRKNSFTSNNQNGAGGHSGAAAAAAAVAAKGIVIDDVTENLIKSLTPTHGAYSDGDHDNIGLDHEDDDDDDDLCDNELKVPFVDLVADSPSSSQNDDDADAEDFLNSSLFLNTDDTTTTATDRTSMTMAGCLNSNTLNDENTTASSTTTTTTSSILDNGKMKASGLNAENHNAAIYEPLKAMGTTAQTMMPKQNDPPALRRTISSSQLLDHVESFQVDLSSIRDILTTQNCFENSMLENLFTPEHELQHLDYGGMMANKQFTQLYNPNQYEKNQYNDSDIKINGNEVTHYDPMNPEMLFTMDDVLVHNQELNDRITTTVPTAYLTATTQPELPTTTTITTTTLPIIDGSTCKQQQQQSIANTIVVEPLGFVDEDFMINHGQYNHTTPATTATNQ